jgi:O-antigen/teichoic acid export membrane protein
VRYGPGLRGVRVSGKAGRVLQSKKPTDASTLRGSLLMFVGRIMASAVGLVTQVMIVWGIGKPQFGVFAAAMATAALIQSMLPLGLDRADTRFLTLYHEEGDVGRVLGVVGTELSVTVGTGVLALAGMIGYLTLTGGMDESGLVVMVLLVTAPLQAMDAMVLNVFAVFARPTAVFFRRYVLDPGLRLLVVVVLLITGMSVRSLAIGYVAAGLFASLLYLGMLVRLLRAVVREAGARFELRWPGRPLFVFAMPLLAGAVMYAATTALPVLALNALSTKDQVAELRAVQQLAQVMLIVPTAFGTLFLPRAARQVARGEGAELRQHYWATAAWVSVLAFPVALPMIAFADLVTTTLYPDAYAHAATALTIMGVAFFTNAALGLNGSVLQVAGRVKQLMWSNVAGLAVVVLSALVLIRPFGSTGAAIVIALGLAIPQAMKQWSLRGLPVGASHPAARRLWLAVTVLTLACAGSNAVWHPAVVPAGVLTVLAWGVLLVVMRRDLDVAQVLPMPGRRGAGGTASAAERAEHRPASHGRA